MKRVRKYREKSCKKCGVSHRKQGIYCSQACANADRIVSEETKEKISESRREYFDTPEGAAFAARLSERNKTLEPLVKIDDYSIDIPTIHDLPPGYDPAEDW